MPCWLELVLPRPAAWGPDHAGFRPPVLVRLAPEQRSGKARSFWRERMATGALSRRRFARLWRRRACAGSGLIDFGLSLGTEHIRRFSRSAKDAPAPRPRGGSDRSLLAVARSPERPLLSMLLVLWHERRRACGLPV